jgi:hypothetical protein
VEVGGALPQLLGDAEVLVEVLDPVDPGVWGNTVSSGYRPNPRIAGGADERYETIFVNDKESMRKSAD